MEGIKTNYQNLDRAFIRSFFIAIILFVISLGLNYFASQYATLRAGPPVGDIILDNIPVLELDFLHSYGPVFFWLIILIFILKKPQTLPFTLKAIALFVVIRSIFVVLTHLGVSGDAIQAEAPLNFIEKLSYGGDLFFSGHTGLPFLMALNFWSNKWLRIFCLISAVFFGTLVLLVHRHYSIDVLAAFFITYTIHDLAKHFFPTDYKLFLDR
jgi:hypothetical protein